MNTDRLARTTFVLDKVTHDELAYIAERMKVSRSELVRDVLAEPVSLMAKWVRSLPEQPTMDDAERVGAELQLDMLEFIERKAAQVQGGQG